MNGQDALFSLFGVHGSDPETAARLSRVQFVRDQDHVAIYRTGATGRVLSAYEALRFFGFEKLLDILQFGSAVIVSSRGEPGNTIKLRRNALGLSTAELAAAANVLEAEVLKLEEGKSRRDIHIISAIAQSLGLDEGSISFSRDVEAGDALAVRLKEVVATKQRLRSTGVAPLAEAAWVGRTEVRLRKWTGEANQKWCEFTPVSDYGTVRRPAWKVGYELASKARAQLGIPADSPIESMSDLIKRLGIPLVQTILPKRIAGATISVADNRFIVVNVRGTNSNPLVRRATIAHELGHLLWDPPGQLNQLTVDDYSSLHSDYGSENDIVEARANAFAIAFLAPPKAVVKLYNKSITPGIGLRNVMVTFGISKTAARYHIVNSFQNGKARFRDDLRQVRCDSSAPLSWDLAENITLDWFPVESTPLSRRGSFLNAVLSAERGKVISADTAATFLKTNRRTFDDQRTALFDVAAMNSTSK